MESGEQCIDVVIPSFRLEEEILLRIFELKQPDDFLVRFYLIADNPQVRIPGRIRQLAGAGRIDLMVNPENLGFSASRNKGIRAGSGKWILLLDDDIIPDDNLLLAYGKAAREHPGALGLAGVADFPEPFNTVTRALDINGSTVHFKLARYQSMLAFPSTANMILNREKLDASLFDTRLTKGGEDVDFLIRNSLDHDQQYISVPRATVVHPWWGGGTSQLRRLFRYGWGSGVILPFRHIRPYAFRDFTNTSETLLLLLVAGGILWLAGAGAGWLPVLVLIVVLAEFITNLVRSIVLGKTFDIPLAWQMMLHKNAHDAGLLCACLSKGRWYDIGKRLDLSFRKPHPSPFRLNRWKILKLVLIAAGVVYLISAG